MTVNKVNKPGCMGMFPNFIRLILLIRGVDNFLEVGGGG